jgi:branched-subunit amino acid transport protein
MNKTSLITILITSIIAYVTRLLFLYLSSVDILSIEEHPLITFLHSVSLFYQ